MSEARFHVMYYDNIEGCWRFKFVTESELEKMLENVRYEVRHYTKEV